MLPAYRARTGPSCRFRCRAAEPEAPKRNAVDRIRSAKRRRGRARSMNLRNRFRMKCLTSPAPNKSIRIRLDRRSRVFPPVRHHDRTVEAARIVIERDGQRQRDEHKRAQNGSAQAIKSLRELLAWLPRRRDCGLRSCRTAHRECWRPPSMVPSSAGLSISSFPSRIVAVYKPHPKAASRHARPRGDFTHGIGSGARARDFVMARRADRVTFLLAESKSESDEPEPAHHSRGRCAARSPDLFWRVELSAS